MTHFKKNRLIKFHLPDNKLASLKEVSFLEDSKCTIESFDSLFFDFGQTLSKAILTNKLLKRIPAFTALGFWLRKSNLEELVKESSILENRKYLFPKGLVLHICPANVDTMFVYSLMISLLCGNKNLLRISRRIDSPLISELILLLNNILASDQYRVLKEYIHIVSYDRDHDITDYFSSIADVRIIWGGDNTISVFKKFTTKPRVKDLYFADRNSMSIIKPKSFFELDEKGKEVFIKNFYNDVYTFDQLGCSCPQSLFILGSIEDADKFLIEFEVYLRAHVEKMYDNDIFSIANLKLNKIALDCLDQKIDKVYNPTNYVNFVQLKASSLLDSCGAGYLYYKQINDLTELNKFINKKVQSISYLGLSQDEIRNILLSNMGEGIDRIVPVGKALNFHYLWDGFNLFNELTSSKYY